ncbi:hypothetical protein WISP_90024 [Willisornis vidua]|uniref:Phospholipase A2 n=1 Tax=Willisornis vidua TaxID=1566151 RepID=A0ABQ9D224_9PASS|nr:hypothetical protein WISP_90024 [Willisornis vidua]
MSSYQLGIGQVLTLSYPSKEAGDRGGRNILEIKVYDENAVTKDDLLFTILFDIAKIQLGETVCLTFQLNPKSREISCLEVLVDSRWTKKEPSEKDFLFSVKGSYEESQTLSLGSFWQPVKPLDFHYIKYSLSELRVALAEKQHHFNSCSSAEEEKDSHASLTIPLDSLPFNEKVAVAKDETINLHVKSNDWSRNLDVRLEFDLCKEEKNFLQKRKKFVASALKKALHLDQDLQDHEKNNHKLSDERQALSQGQNPLPIYMILNMKEDYSLSEFKEWVEFTPYEVGFLKYGAFIRADDFGSKFFMGRLMKKLPESRICFMKGDESSPADGSHELETYLVTPECGIMSIIRRLLTERVMVSKFYNFLKGFQVHNAYLQSKNFCLWKDTVLENFPNQLTETAEFMCLADTAGYIDISYPPLMRPERKVDVVLHLNYSSGSQTLPLEEASKYFQKQGIPFPKIHMSEEEKKNLKECYIFEDRETPEAPTVVFFPLVNDSFRKYKEPGVHPANMSWEVLPVEVPGVYPENLSLELLPMEVPGVDPEDLSLEPLPMEVPGADTEKISLELLPVEVPGVYPEMMTKQSLPVEVPEVYPENKSLELLPMEVPEVYPENKWLELLPAKMSRVYPENMTKGFLPVEVPEINPANMSQESPPMEVPELYPGNMSQELLPIEVPETLYYMNPGKMMMLSKTKGLEDEDSDFDSLRDGEPQEKNNESTVPDKGDFKIESSPCYLLTVRVIRMRNLQRMDALSQADCYVSLWLPTATCERSRTKTVRNSNNPVWNETFYFRIQSQVKNVLELTVYDEDFATPDDQLLCAVFDTAKLPIERTVILYFKPSPNAKEELEVEFKLESTSGPHEIIATNGVLVCRELCCLEVEVAEKTKQKSKKELSLTVKGSFEGTQDIMLGPNGVVNPSCPTKFHYIKYAEPTLDVMLPKKRRYRPWSCKFSTETGSPVLMLNSLPMGRKTTVAEEKRFDLNVTAQTCNCSCHQDLDMRFGFDLCSEERAFLGKRKRYVASALKSVFHLPHDLQDQEVPVVAIITTGGGLKSMTGLYGSLMGLKKLNLLDCITYISGLSGTTWTMANLYRDAYWSQKDLDSHIGEAQRQATKCKMGCFSKDRMKYYNKQLCQRKEEGYRTSFIDLWGLMIEYLLNDGKDPHKLSEQQEALCDGQNPLPIYVSVSVRDSYSTNDFKDVVYGRAEQNLTHAEKHAHMVCKIWSLAMFPVCTFATGNTIMNSKTARVFPLPPCLSSAACTGVEWVEFTPYEVGLLKYGAFVRTEHFGSEFFMGRLLKKLPESRICYLQGMWSSIFSVNLLQIWGLSHSSEDFWKRWTQDRIEEVDEDPVLPTRPHELRTRMYTPPGPLSSALRGALTDRFSVAQHHNFLKGYQLHNSYMENEHFCKWKDTVLDSCPNQLMQNPDQLGMIDAGFFINTSSAPLLRPQREVDVIIYLSYTTGSHTSALDKACKYYSEQKIPFPNISLTDEDKKNLKECYIFHDSDLPGCPIVIFLPLVNDTFQEYKAPVSQTDCYVSLWLPTASNDKFQTKAIKNCKDPVWNETFYFRIQSQVKNVLELALYDKDIVTQDDHLFTVYFDIAKLALGEEVFMHFKCDSQKQEELEVGFALDNISGPPETIITNGVLVSRKICSLEVQVVEKQKKKKKNKKSLSKKEFSFKVQGSYEGTQDIILGSDLVFSSSSPAKFHYARYKQPTLDITLPGNKRPPSLDKEFDLYVKAEDCPDHLDVRLGFDLCMQEQDFLCKRQNYIAPALKKVLQLEQDLLDHETPVVAIMTTGGGMRSLTALYGSLRGLKKLSVLDCATYLTGLSGTTWTMSNLYRDADWSQKDLDKQISEARKHMTKCKINSLSLEYLKYYKKQLCQRKREGHRTSFIDLWGLVLESLLHDGVHVTIFLESQKDNHRLSDQQRAIDRGQNPLPIYTAVNVKNNYSTLDFKEWVEFTPYEVGLQKYGVFVRTEDFGSEFFMGRLMKKVPESRICFLEDTVLDTFPNQLTQSDEFLSLVDTGFFINTSVMPLLKPERKVDVILHLNYSAGSQIQALDQTCKYCSEQGIPFPRVDMSEEDRKNLKECYLFDGAETPEAPVLLFFPLINDTFQKYKAPGQKRSEAEMEDGKVDLYGCCSPYSTYSLQYTEKAYDRLVQLSEYNILNNQDLIMQALHTAVTRKRMIKK